MTELIAIILAFLLTFLVMGLAHLLNLVGKMKGPSKLVVRAYKPLVLNLLLQERVAMKVLDDHVTNRL